MEFKEVNYKVKAFITQNDERTLTENDIKEYYKNQGYNVYHNYAKKIREGKFILSPETVNLFNVYKDGYPDFMLVSINDPGLIKFVEVKLDNDSIRPNQIEFNNKLALLEDTSVIYFNNRGRYVNKDNITYVSKSTKTDKEIIKRLDSLAYIQQKKKFKVYWVVAELYKEYGKFILKKEITGIIADKLNIRKKNVVWFTKNNLIKE